MIAPDCFENAWRAFNILATLSLDVTLMETTEYFSLSFFLFRCFNIDNFDIPYTSVYIVRVNWEDSLKLLLYVNFKSSNSIVFEWKKKKFVSQLRIKKKKFSIDFVIKEEKVKSNEALCFRMFTDTFFFQLGREY